MYKAMEYPKLGKQQDHLYISDSVRRRFKGLRRELECVGLRVCDAARLSGIKYRFWRDYITCDCYPIMLQYFKLAEFMGWDLSRDVNWHYAHVLHSQEEIQQRARRVLPECNSIQECARLLGAEFGYGSKTIMGTMRYRDYRSAHVYGLIMHWIMEQEKSRGLDDPLDLEK